MSTLCDTSELQREAFNGAFDAHGLGWHWDREQYAGMLAASGGRQRIADHAAFLGQDVDADGVHATKSELLQARLSRGDLELRDGILETLTRAKAHQLTLALVTTTSRGNVDALLAGLAPVLPRDDLDLVLSLEDVQRAKPDPEVYALAASRLGQDAAHCVAVEDNVAGVTAATAASMPTIAFPNTNTRVHDFSHAARTVDRLDLDDVLALLAT